MKSEFFLSLGNILGKDTYTGATRTMEHVGQAFAHCVHGKILD